MQNRLMKVLAAVVCACLVAAGFAVAPCVAQEAGQGGAAAIVTFVKRSVWVKRAGAEKYEKLKVNTMLYKGDAVRVKKWSRAGLALACGAEVRLNSNSYFELTGEEKSKK